MTATPPVPWGIVEAEVEAELRAEAEDPRDVALRVAGERIRELEAKLAATGAPPEPDLVVRIRETTQVDGVYSCAVCSCKVDLPAIAALYHPCCDRTAYVGACCTSAAERSPEDVLSILSGSNHDRRCPGRR